MKLAVELSPFPPLRVYEALCAKCGSVLLRYPPPCACGFSMDFALPIEPPTFVSPWFTSRIKQ